MPVWRDADGNLYDSFDELGLDHLKGVVALLTRRAEEAQKEYKKQKGTNRERRVLGDAYYDSYVAPFERRWRELLLLLEDASRTLRRRLDSDNAFKLDPAPQTPQEVLTRAGSVLGEAPRRVGKQRGSLVSPAKEGKIVEGKIVERPRKLRIEGS